MLTCDMTKSNLWISWGVVAKLRSVVKIVLRDVKIVELPLVQNRLLLQLVETLTREVLLYRYTFDPTWEMAYSLGLLGASSALSSYLVDSVGFSLP